MSCLLRWPWPISSEKRVKTKQLHAVPGTTDPIARRCVPQCKFQDKTDNNLFFLVKRLAGRSKFVRMHKLVCENTCRKLPTGVDNIFGYSQKLGKRFPTTRSLPPPHHTQGGRSPSAERRSFAFGDSKVRKRGFALLAARHAHPPSSGTNVGGQLTRSGRSL